MCRCMFMQKSKSWQGLVEIIVYTMTFGMLAHAYCYFNLQFSHDSLWALYQKTDNAWQIGLGRFLQPVYRCFRGEITAPFLIGALSLLWLAIAIFILVRVLDLKYKWSVVLICGILSTNVVLTLANATYLPWSDVFMLSFLFSVSAVYVSDRYTYGFIGGAFFICASLALYQSYFQVSVILFMILLIKHIYEGEPPLAVIRKAIYAGCSLVIALILYYVFVKFSLCVTGLKLVDHYNGLVNVLDFSKVSVVQLCFQAFKRSIMYFINPDGKNNYHFLALINVAVLLFLVSGVLRICCKNKICRLNISMLATLIILMPLGMNIVYVISKGLEHTLMIFSFFFVYVFVVYVSDYNCSLKSNWNYNNFTMPLVLKCVTVTMFGLFIFSNIIFANQVYLRKSLEFQATLSVMTRIVDRIEQTPGFDAANNRVAIIGDFVKSPLSKSRPGFERVSGVGICCNYAPTYYQTFDKYFAYILGYPIALISEDEAKKLARLPEVRVMRSFPAIDSCKVINKVMIVKISDIR